MTDIADHVDITATFPNGLDMPFAKLLISAAMRMSFVAERSSNRHERPNEVGTATPPSGLAR